MASRKHDHFFQLRAIYFFLLFVLASSLESKQLDIDVQAESAILINADTGAVLYEKNADEAKYPASIIKIVTTLYALEKQIPLDTKITASKEAVRVINASAKQKDFDKYPSYLLEHDVILYGAKAGETFDLETLLYGTILHSDADFCNIMAEGLEGSIPKYVECCNKFLKANQINSTIMTNPHGLPHPKQVTTARDMAKIAQLALKNPKFRQIASTLVYTVPPTNLTPQPVSIMNSNRLLRKGSFFYPKAIGLKTGYMSYAKHTIVAAAQDENGRTLIAVLLKEPKRELIFLESKKMFEKAYAEAMTEKKYLSEGKLPFELHMTKSKIALPVAAKSAIALATYPSEEVPAKIEYAWNTDLQLPISKGDPVGRAKLVAENGQVLHETEIYSMEDREEPTMDKIIRILTQPASIIIVLILAILALLIRARR